MKQLDTVRKIGSFVNAGETWRFTVVRRAYENDGSVPIGAFRKNREQIKSRLPAGVLYETSVSSYQVDNTPVLLEEECLFERIAGKFQKGAPSQRVTCEFPPLPSDWRKVAEVSAAPSVGRLSVPINLDLNLLMPAPIVNVPAAPPLPPVNVRNEVNIPQTQKLTILRDSDGKITGADIERSN